jgi:DNA-directed RNA polymerase beta subunit
MTETALVLGDGADSWGMKTLGAHINSPSLISDEDQTPSQKLLYKYLSEVGICPGNYDVMNQVLTELIPRSIKAVRIDGTNGTVYQFINPVILPPSYQVAGRKTDLLPQMARKKGRTYGGDIFVSVVQRSGPSETDPIIDIRENVRLATGLPIMLRSKLCHLYGAKDAQLLAAGEDPKDCFQYFIVGGSEKVVLGQEKLDTNRIFIMKIKKKEGPVCRLTVETDTSTQIIEVGLDKKTNTVLKLRLPGLKRAEGSRSKDSDKGKASDSEFDLDIEVKKKNDEKRYGSINVLHALQIMGFGDDSRGVSDLGIFRSYIKEFIPSDSQADSMSKLYATEIDFKIKSDYRPQTIDRLARKLYRDYIPDKKSQGTSVSVAEVTGRILSLLDRELFPHLNDTLGPDEGETEEQRLSRIRSDKVTLLCIMISQMLQHLAGFVPATDRNSWSNKKVELSGRLFLQLFNAALRKQVSAIKYKDKKLTLVPSMDVLINSINPNYVEEIFYSSLNTSTWGVKSGNKKLNYARSLTREALAAGWSDVTRVDVNVDRNGNAGEVQNMNTSSFGFIDSIDCPEGEHCGLLKNFAVTTRVSLKVSYSTLLDRLVQGGYASKQLPDKEGKDMLMVMSHFLGWCHDGEELERTLRSWRRAGMIPIDTTIVRVNGWLYVHLSPSRPMRPLLIVDPDTQTLLIDTMGLRNSPVREWFTRGAAEYLSPWEQEYIKVALKTDDIDARKELQGRIIRDFEEARSALSENPSDENQVKFDSALEALEDFRKNKPYTHCEIDPATQFSVQGNLINYPEHNQGPRNSYQANMEKQVLGTYHVNHVNRFDGTIKVLDMGQVPLCSTLMYSFIGLHQRNTGVQTNTLFAAFPYTEEDAFVMCKQFIEAGGQRMVKYMTYKAIVRVADEKLTRPRSGKPSIGGYDKYHSIEDGLPYIGAYLKSGDCVIGKETRVSDGLSIAYKDTSVFVKPGDHGIVDSISVGSNRSEEVVIIKLRITRAPSLGDKFAASASQKGTISGIFPDTVLPRDETGTAPGIITNTSSLPSRMTMSYPTEQYWSTVASYEGRTANSSAFYQQNDPRDIYRAESLLRSYGREEMAYHRMISGTTGLWLKNLMNMGIVFFHQLRHHAADKYQDRGPGTVRAINHQPPKGKVKKGGLRIGEMERDVFLSHGASGITQERLMRTSDQYTIILCLGCGTIVTGNIVETGCNDCGNSSRDGFAVVKIPYAIKLLIHYLAVMHIRVSLGAITSDQYAARVWAGQRDLTIDPDKKENLDDKEDVEYEDELDSDPQDQDDLVEHYEDAHGIEF